MSKQVTRLQMLSLTDAEADELLLPYRGVISYHREALRHLKSGPCVALKIEVCVRVCVHLALNVSVAEGW